MTNASFANLAVLVVDDNKDMRGLLEGIVREFGVRSIESARDGASALSAMVAKPVGLVLCDIQMRPMDGLEFVKTVRRGHLGIERSVPIILLTAHSEIYRVKEAGMVGADEFVTKPVSAATLHDRMLSVITRPLSSLVAARQENAARIDGSDHTAAAGPHPGDDGHGGDDGHAAAERARAVVAKLAGAYMESVPGSTSRRSAMPTRAPRPSRRSVARRSNGSPLSPTTSKGRGAASATP